MTIRLLIMVSFLSELSSYELNRYARKRRCVEERLRFGNDRRQPCLEDVRLGYLELISSETIEGVVGDVDSSGQVDIGDIDALSNAIFTQDTSPVFDLDRSSTVDLEDLSFLVEGVLNTWIGDVDLDGEFNTRDLVDLFQRGEYEDKLSQNSTWSDGDWNADLEFTSSDLVSAFQSSGYERGPRAAVAVPEPDALCLLMGMLIVATAIRSLRGTSRYHRLPGEVRCCSSSSR